MCLGIFEEGASPGWCHEMGDWMTWMVKFKDIHS